MLDHGSIRFTVSCIRLQIPSSVPADYPCVILTVDARTVRQPVGGATPGCAVRRVGCGCAATGRASAIAHLGVTSRDLRKVPVATGADSDDWRSGEQGRTTGRHELTQTAFAVPV